MTLRKLNWAGRFSSLSIKRNWNTFFGLATIYKLNALRSYEILTEGAGHHILSIYDNLSDLRKKNENFDVWWEFSKTLCDGYGDYYVLGRPLKNNLFHRLNAQYPVTLEQVFFEFCGKS